MKKEYKRYNFNDGLYHIDYCFMFFNNMRRYEGEFISVLFKKR